jgi:hypothetical protein
MRGGGDYDTCFHCREGKTLQRHNIFGEPTTTPTTSKCLETLTYIATVEAKLALLYYGLNTRMNEQSTAQTGQREILVLHSRQHIW